MFIDRQSDGSFITRAQFILAGITYEVGMTFEKGTAIEDMSRTTEEALREAKRQMKRKNKKKEREYGH